MEANKIKVACKPGDFHAWTGANQEGAHFFIRPGQAIEVEADEHGEPLAESLREGLATGHLEVVHA